MLSPASCSDREVLLCLCTLCVAALGMAALGLAATRLATCLRGAPQAIQSMLAALGAGGKREIKNRSLPFSELCSFLSKLLGVPGEALPSAAPCAVRAELMHQCQPWACWGEALSHVALRSAPVVELVLGVHR